MSGFHDLSTTAASNTSIDGISVAEGCPPGNINNVCRSIGAFGKLLADEVAAISPGMPTSGGIFTGGISRSTQGAYLNYASSALTNGLVYVLPEGTALPTGAEGVMVFFYT